jgi:transcriptional regulator with XRE-family HTH domain
MLTINMETNYRHIMDRSTVAKKVADILKSKKITQNQLAEDIQVSRSSISNVLSGGSYSKKLIHKIAERLGVSVDFLLNEFHTKNYGVIDTDLFSACIVIVAKTIKKEGVEIKDYNNIIIMGLELYELHQKKKINVYKNQEACMLFVTGIINQQVRTGIIPKKDEYAQGYPNKDGNKE